MLAGKTLCSILSLLSSWRKEDVSIWPPQFLASAQRQGPCLARSGIVLSPSPGLARECSRSRKWRTSHCRRCGEARSQQHRWVDPGWPHSTPPRTLCLGLLFQAPPACEHHAVVPLLEDWRQVLRSSCCCFLFSSMHSHDRPCSDKEEWHRIQK